jgi:hypothetical protein
MLIVATALSNHPNDKQEAEPTLEALSPQLGQPPASALDNGYWSEPNLQAFAARGIEPYIAAGRKAHHQSWRTFFAEEPLPPAKDASPAVKCCRRMVPGLPGVQPQTAARADDRINWGMFQRAYCQDRSALRHSRPLPLT